MKCFIVYTTYRMHHEKTYVYFIGRLENGQSFAAIKQTDPYFYIKTKDVKKAKKINKDLKIQETKCTNFAQEPVSKVIVGEPKEVSSLRKIFEEEKIICYEADIRFTQRCLIDLNLHATVEIKGDYDIEGRQGTIYDKYEAELLKNVLNIKTEYWNPSWVFVSWEELFSKMDKINKAD